MKILSAKQLRAKEGDILVKADQRDIADGLNKMLGSFKYFEINSISSVQMEIHGITSLGHMHFFIDFDLDEECWVDIIRKENRFKSNKQKKIMDD